MNDLGTLGGRHSTAYGINASGQVAGESRIAGDAETHAFLYSGGTLADLGTLGGTHSAAYGINASGQVVGGAFTVGNVERHAFLYSGGTLADLNALLAPGSGWTLHYATGINDSGQITGSGDINGEIHAFLLTPVPKPATLALLGLCLPALRLRR
jgi:probable HAF family extracellular repeat protein